MPPYLTTENVWATILVHASTALITGIVLLPMVWRRGGTLARSEIAGVLIAMSFIGVVTGYMTGLSRAPVVGAVLPGILTLIGGLVIFIATRETTSEFRALTATCVIALMITLLLGTSWGSLSREDPGSLNTLANNQELLREAICYKRLAFEMEVREARKKAGLPEVNANTLVPGCTPPFSTQEYAPLDEAKAAQ